MHLYFVEEMFGQVAGVETHGLVGIVPVVVPVEQSAWRFRPELITRCPPSTTSNRFASASDRIKTVTRACISADEIAAEDFTDSIKGGRSERCRPCRHR